MKEESSLPIISYLPLVGLIFWLYIDYKAFCHEYETGIKRPAGLRIALQLKIFWHGIIVMIPTVIIVMLLCY